jgi:hypothetical protein
VNYIKYNSNKNQSVVAILILLEITKVIIPSMRDLKLINIYYKLKNIEKSILLGNIKIVIMNIKNKMNMIIMNKNLMEGINLISKLDMLLNR